MLRDLRGTTAVERGSAVRCVDLRIGIGIGAAQRRGTDPLLGADLDAPCCRLRRDSRRWFRIGASVTLAIALVR